MLKSCRSIFQLTFLENVDKLLIRQSVHRDLARHLAQILALNTSGNVDCICQKMSLWSIREWVAKASLYSLGIWAPKKSCLSSLILFAFFTQNYVNKLIFWQLPSTLTFIGNKQRKICLLSLFWECTLQGVCVREILPSFDVRYGKLIPNYCM